MSVPVLSDEQYEEAVRFVGSQLTEVLANMMGSTPRHRDQLLQQVQYVQAVLKLPVHQARYVLFKVTEDCLSGLLDKTRNLRQRAYEDLVQV